MGTMILLAIFGTVAFLLGTGGGGKPAPKVKMTSTGCPVDAHLPDHLLIIVNAMLLRPGVTAEELDIEALAYGAYPMTAACFRLAAANLRAGKKPEPYQPPPAAACPSWWPTETLGACPSGLPSVIPVERPKDWPPAWPWPPGGGQPPPPPPDQPKVKQYTNTGCEVDADLPPQMLQMMNSLLENKATPASGLEAAATSMDWAKMPLAAACLRAAAAARKGGQPPPVQPPPTGSKTLANGCPVEDNAPEYVIGGANVIIGNPLMGAGAIVAAAAAFKDYPLVYACLMAEAAKKSGGGGGGNLPPLGVEKTYTVQKAPGGGAELASSVAQRATGNANRWRELDPLNPHLGGIKWFRAELMSGQSDYEYFPNWKIGVVVKVPADWNV